MYLTAKQLYWSWWW